MPLKVSFATKFLRALAVVTRMRVVPSGIVSLHMRFAIGVSCEILAARSAFVFCHRRISSLLPFHGPIMPGGGSRGFCLRSIDV